MNDDSTKAELFAGGHVEKKLAFIVAAIAVVGLGLAWGVARFYNATTPDFEMCRGGAVAGGDIGGPFTLVDETGQTVTDADVLDVPALVYFGYSYCPDVCPIDAMRNGIAIEVLEENTGIEARPIFISIDPERDTPEALAQYTDNFHPRMLGLTGTLDQVAAAAREWKVVYQRVDNPRSQNYLMDHSAFSYITLPEVGYVDFVRREDTPEDVAERMACFVRAAGLD